MPRIKQIDRLLSNEGVRLDELLPEEVETEESPNGYAHKHDDIRWYLTTVSREQLAPKQVIQACRLRWSIELLFRELEQNVDLGRSFTAHPDAIEALTYAAMLGHVAVRSLRVQAALANEVPLTQLRPLACLRVAKAFARDIIDALLGSGPKVWAKVVADLDDAFMQLAREKKTSRSRMRIPLEMGAAGAQQIGDGPTPPCATFEAGRAFDPRGSVGTNEAFAHRNRCT